MSNPQTAHKTASGWLIIISAILKTMYSTLKQFYLHVKPSHCPQNCTGSIYYHFSDPENCGFYFNTIVFTYQSLALHTKLHRES